MDRWAKGWHRRSEPAGVPGLGSNARPARGKVRRRQRGFTLVELGIVLAIIAILVGVSVPMYAMIVNEARSAEARQAWNMVRTELWTYFMRYGNFPAVGNNGWWSGIDPAPASNYWTYSAKTDGNKATLIATRTSNNAEKLCWTLDDKGTVTENTNAACR